MNKLQEHLLQLMREIRDICDANGITCYLIGGSLIGAVRNRGFLPWDDDADVAMTYEGYIRFREACRTQLPPNRYLGDPTEDETYSHLLPRYMSTDTTAIHTAQALHECVRGVVVDIFVLDPVADTGESYQAYLQDMFLLSSIVNYANAAAWRIELDPGLYEEYEAIARDKGQLHAARLIEERMVSHFGDDCDKYAYRWQIVPWLLDRSWFEEGQQVEFEGEMFTAPKEINANLTGYFGEEWTHVPRYVTPAKHDCALSLACSYEEALDCFDPDDDADEILEGMKRRRHDIICNAKASNALSDEWVELKARIAEEELRRVISENKNLFLTAYAKRDGHVLAGLFDGFLQWQTSREAIGRHGNMGYYRFTRPVCAIVPDDVFMAALLALVDTDRVRFASRLLEVRRDSEMGLSAEMEALGRDIGQLHGAMSDIEHGRYSDGLKKAEALMRAYPGASRFAEVACAAAKGVLHASGGDEGALEAYEALADLCIGRFPGNGAFRKAKADCLAARGRHGDADELYLAAAEMTLNGLVLLDIADATGYRPKWLRSAPWAKAAGIAPWGGSEPKVPRLGAAEGGSNRPVLRYDGKQALAVSLLEELCALCDESRVPYLLGPNAAAALVKGGLPPRAIEDYAILCHPCDAVRLLSVLERAVRATPDRAIEFRGGDPVRRGYKILYADTGSLYLERKNRKAMADCRGMYVQVLFPMVDDCPPALRNALKANRAAFLLPRRTAKAAFARSGRHLLAGIASFSRDAVSLSVLRGEERVGMDGEWFERRSAIGFDGRRFAVPDDLDRYLSLSDPRSKGASAMAIGVNAAMTNCFGYRQLVGSGLFDETFFTRFAADQERNRDAKAVKARFREYFASVKRAVHAKDRALR